MNSPNLMSHLGLHRRAYFFAGLWAALWAGLLVAFFWHFRFVSGLASDHAEFDAMMRKAVSDEIAITRYAVMYSLVPASALLASLVLLVTDAFLYLMNLDRERLWLNAVKWSFSGWKAFLSWVAVNLSVYLIPVLVEQEYAIWASMAIVILLMVMLPFVVLNKEYVSAEKSGNIGMPGWPGSQSVLWALAFIVVLVPLSFYYGEYVEQRLNIWLTLPMDILQHCLFAMALIFLSDFWINKRKGFFAHSNAVISWKNVGCFFSLNVMSGTWVAVLLAPPLACAVLVNFFLLPSIFQSGQWQYENYQLMSALVEGLRFVIAYWWLFLFPGLYWLLVHAYGRLIFLLDLVDAEPVVAKREP